MPLPSSPNRVAELTVRLQEAHLEPSSSTANPRSYQQEIVSMEEVVQEGITSAYTGLSADELFDLTMCSDEAMREVPSLLFGITRISFIDGILTFGVANRDLDTEETSLFIPASTVSLSLSEFEVEVIDKQKALSKLKRIATFLRHRVLRQLMERTINGNGYEIEKTIVKGLTNVEIEGVNYEMYDSRKKFTIFSISPSDTYKDIFKHLFAIFPNEAPLFHLDLRGIQVDQWTLIEGLLSIEQIQQAGSAALRIGSNEFVSTAHVTIEWMTELNALRLDYGRLDTEFFTPKMCSVDHLTAMYNRNPISSGNLVRLRNKTVKLWHPTIDPEALNDFIKCWWHSSNTKLEHLVIPLLYCDKDDDFDKRVLMGLPDEKYVEGRRAEWYLSHDWDFQYNTLGKTRHTNCKSGRDLLRQDGLLATIVVNPNFFYFFVWHDRFPEQPREVPYIDSNQ